MAGLTKQQVNDLYRGIIMPQGGAFQPGPPVMLPPQGMGGNQALGQKLIGQSSMPTNWFNRQSSSGALPYSGQSIPGANGSLVENKDQARLPTGPAGNLFAYGDPSVTAPAQGAIEDATRPTSPPTGFGYTQWGDAASGLDWKPATPSPAPAGDPWQGMRIGGPVPQTPGMTTGNVKGLAALGNPAAYSQPTAPALSAYQQALTNAAAKTNTTPEVIHQQLMAQQTDKPQQAGEQAGSGFLRAQGQNTAGMSPGQIANALNKSIFGKGFGH